MKESALARHYSGSSSPSGMPLIIPRSLPLALTDAGSKLLEPLVTGRQDLFALREGAAKNTAASGVCPADLRPRGLDL